MDRMLPPRNVKELKRYIGMVNFYRDCFERRSHILAPLTELAADREQFVVGVGHGFVSVGLDQGSRKSMPKGSFD